jgi:hypothetical protein
MRHTVAPAVAWCAFVLSGATTAEPVRPDVELQSEALTPGLVLSESRRPVHQVRLLVEATAGRGALVLDPNVPEFDESGGLVGGIRTSQAGKEGGPLRVVELRCVIASMTAGPDGWLLFRLEGPKITSSLRLATRGRVGEGGPARLLVLGADKKVKTVVRLMQSGLAVP